jgi:ABC-type glutathione transport system ATPase component
VSSRQTLLELRDVSKTYHARRRHPVTALEGISFRVLRGQVTALVGESGSGKSTTVRCVLGLDKPDSGAIVYKGQRLTASTDGLGRARHREIQVVFQDPTASLNPRMSAADLIGEGLIVHGLTRTPAAAAPATSPEASGSGSPSPARSPSSPSCSSAMRRSPRSMSRSRRRS